MSEIIALNKELIDTAHKIQAKSNEVEKARKEYLTSKDFYEKELSSAMVILKTANSKLTQTDIKAQAVEQTYQIKLDMRVKESAYRTLLLDLQALRDLLKSLEEIGYNLRAEMKLTHLINQ